MSSGWRSLAALVWLFAAAYMLLIWLLSAQSQPWLPPSLLTWDDFALHLLEYMVLGALLTQALFFTWPERSSRSQAYWALALTIAWGALDEWHQRHVPGRTAQWQDLLADACGACLGVGSQLLLRQRLAARRRKIEWPASSPTTALRPASPRPPLSRPTPP